MSYTDDYTSPWVLDTFKALAASGPHGDGRVQLGFAVDNLYMPTAAIGALYAELRAAPAKLITVARHGAGRRRAERARRRRCSCWSSTGCWGRTCWCRTRRSRSPATGHGWRSPGPAWRVRPARSCRWGRRRWRSATRTCHATASALGADCHSWGSGYMPGQMRLLLQWARWRRQDELARRGQWSRHVGFGVEEVYNLGTVAGARVIGMGRAGWPDRRRDEG